MKQKHTKARKANRRFAELFQQGNSTVMSEKRYAKRWDSVKARRVQKSFGMQISRCQMIKVREGQFGNPVYKVLKHAVA